MNRTLDWILVIVTFTVLGAVLSIAGYWLFIDNNPPMRHTYVGTMDDRGRVTTTFHRGERMVIVRDSCVTGYGMVFYTRTFIEKKQRLVYFMPSGWIALKAGCRRAFNVVDIPTYMEPGDYQYIVTVDYQNNPLFSNALTLPVPEITIK